MQNQPDIENVEPQQSRNRDSYRPEVGKEEYN
jgi:hypothetical protein